MYSKPLVAFVLVAAACFASGSVGAQTVAAVEQAMVGVSLQAKRLDTALVSLDQIESSLHGTEVDSVGRVANAGRQFTGAVGEATPVGLILRHMKSPHDIRFTRAMLAISANKAVLIADADTGIINRFLPQIESPAAAAESATIRDAIWQTRVLLETLARVPE